MTVCCAVIVAVRLGFQWSSVEQESAVSGYFLMNCIVLHLGKFVCLLFTEVCDRAGSGRGSLLDTAGSLHLVAA